MRKKSNKLASLLFRKDADKEKIELYGFAIYILFSSILHIVSMLVVGWLFDMMVESILFYASFIVIRKFAGGYHAKTPMRCYWFSIITIMVSLLLLKCLTMLNIIYLYYLFISVALIALITIAIISPLDNENKTISYKEKKVYKVISITISTILFFISLSIFNLNETYSIAILFGIFLDAITLLIGKIQFLVSKQL